MDLFDHAVQETIRQEAPLAARMRPRNLDEFVGQENIIGPGKLLRRAIEADRLFSSLIFFGRRTRKRRAVSIGKNSNIFSLGRH